MVTFSPLLPGTQDPMTGQGVVALPAMAVPGLQGSQLSGAFPWPMISSWLARPL